MFVILFYPTLSEGKTYDIISYYDITQPSSKTSTAWPQLVCTWYTTIIKLPSYLNFIFWLPCLNCLQSWRKSRTSLIAQIITMKCLIFVSLFYWKPFLSFLTSITRIEKYKVLLEVSTHVRCLTRGLLLVEEYIFNFNCHISIFQRNIVVDIYNFSWQHKT